MKLKTYRCAASLKIIEIEAKNMREAAVRMAIWSCIDRYVTQNSKIHVQVHTDKTSKWYYVDVKNMKAKVVNNCSEIFI